MFNWGSKSRIEDIYNVTLVITSSVITEQKLLPNGKLIKTRENRSLRNNETFQDDFLHRYIAHSENTDSGLTLTWAGVNCLEKC